MENQNINAPILDLDAIQKAANEAATKAAISAINSYYNGYDSPYKKQVEEYLKKNCIFREIPLPNFVEMIQKNLIEEINKTAEVIAIGDCVKTVRQGLTIKHGLQPDGTMTTSTLFTILADDIDVENDPEASIEIEVSKNKKYDWEEIEVSKNKKYDWEEIEVHIKKDEEEKDFEITLFENHDKPGTYHVASMPYNSTNWLRTAKVKYDDGMTIEIPIMQGVLNNSVLLTIARLLLNKTPIIINTRLFSDSYGIRHDI